MQLSWLQLELLRPGWLLCLAAIPLVVYSSRRSLAACGPWQRIAATVCRSTLVVLVTLALAGTLRLKQVDQPYVVFVTDISDSIDPQGQDAASQFLRDALEHAGDAPTRFVSVGRNPSRPLPLDGARDAQLDTTATNLAAGIELAAAAIPAGYVPRLVLLSDGNQTIGDVRAAAYGSGMPVSTVPLAAQVDPEVYVAGVHAPAQARPLEEVEIEVSVESNQTGKGTIELSRGGFAQGERSQGDSVIAKQAVEVTPGSNRVRLVAAVGETGHSVFTARLQGFSDTRPANNQAAAVVVVVAKPRALLVDPRPELASPLREALENDGFELSAIRPEALPTSLADLQPYSLIIVSNASAAALSGDSLAALHDYVRDFGGGLIAVGGRRAFEAAGYRGSRLEEILPVQGYIAPAEEKQSMAMVLAIDKSKSMEKQQRMTLAKVAASKAVELLDPDDQVGVIAFGTDTAWVSEMHPCSDKPHVLRRIEGLTPSGSTNMYPALERAYLALHDTHAQRKHVIILTDGLSAPGDFGGIARRMAEDGITISTVAVGKEAEQVVLRDIAKAAGGRHHSCNNAEDVPDIVAGETIEATKKTGIREVPFSPQVVSPSPKLVFADFASMPPLQGYVQTTPKSSAELILATDIGDPLLAWWRYGRGISLAFTSDAAGDWAGEWRSWKGYGKFWSRLARLATREFDRRGFAMHVRTEGRGAIVTLDAVDPLGTFRNALDVSMIMTSPDGESNPARLDLIAPGRYQADFHALAEGVYRMECIVQNPTGEIYRETRAAAVGYAEELRGRATNEAMLRDVADVSGGTFNPRPADLFAPSEARAVRPMPLWNALLIAAAMLWVLDVALRKIDFGGKRRIGTGKRKEN